MSTIYHLDYETYSPLNIKDVGAFRYAEHPQCEITLCCIAKGDDEPLLWDRYDPFGSMAAEELIEEMACGDGLIYAHNSQFETAVSRYKFKQTFGFDPPALDRWRCTASMARRASIPWSLAECGEFLKLGIKKNPLGMQLISIFCCPQTRGKRRGERILPTDDVLVTLDGKKVHASEAWKLFRAYCIDDVKTERGVHHSLPAFELKGDALEGFFLDSEMNHGGVPVNLAAIEWAIRLSEEAAEIEGTRFSELTGLKPSQREKVQDWLNERGYDRDNLQEATITNRLENPSGMTPEATEALGIRSRVSFAAVSKLASMSEIACGDSKVRGAFMWAGALRTHRWAGRLIQPQNFRRPTIKGTHEAYEAICGGVDLEGLEFLWGNPLEAIASCIRHFIHSPGHQFFDVDFSNIEARITPWLAGQDDLLQAFRDGRDPYVEMGAFIFSVEEKDITKDQRFVGKQAIIGAGFQIGWEKYQTMCAGYGVNLSDEVCQAAVSAYREKNDKIVSMWKLMQQAAVNAIENPEEVFLVRDKIKFFMARTLPYEALVMMLPSKHCLFYPLPQIRVQWMFKKNKYETEEQANYAFERARKSGKLEDYDRVWKTKAISFWGQEPISKKWMRRDTYGGKLLENAVQATAGDFMSIGARAAQKAGYRIFMLVHDQALAYFEPEKGQSVKEFEQLICTLPKWAGDFPLKAECDLVPFYTKV